MKDGLSPKQIEIVRLYGEGLSTKEIEKATGLCNAGVDYHRHQIFNMLNLKKTNASLIKLAIGFGLVSLCLILKAAPISIVFTNPNGATNGVNIYYTTNIATPTNQWALLVYLTNSPPGTNTFTTNLPPADYFFTAEFTNSFWGFRLPFSNGAATPPLPTNPVANLLLLNH